MKNFNLIIFGLMMAGFFTACELVEDIKSAPSTEDGVEAMQEFAIVNKQFQDASNASDATLLEAEVNTIAQLAGEGQIKRSVESPVITVEPYDLTTFPKNITVDFGEGITGKDGIMRSGKLHILSENGWYGQEGSVHTTTYENFVQNGYQIEGTNVATNAGMVEGEGLKFNVTVSNGKVSKDGATIYYTQDTERIWVAGDDTPMDIWDDEYTLDGIQTGKSSKDVEYEISITDPLHFVVLTKEITDGKMAVVIEGLPNIELDYSNLTMTVGGVPFPMNN